MLLLLINVFIPLNVFAYSDYILAGGQNIGIELNSNGDLIVGTYKIGAKDPARDADLQTGDKIISINNKEISSIEEMLDIIASVKNPNNIDITYMRGSKTNYTTLNLVMDSNSIYKTGLYVKDSINGVGTLTFIDPNTKIYGALGHEIIESNSLTSVEVRDGTIFESYVTSIDRSTVGNAGTKNAKFNQDNIYGNVNKNTESGIYGIYKDKIDNSNLIEVGEPRDLKLGKAFIYTVISGNEVKMYEINITNINYNSSIKNISFEVISEELLNITGGIVQGMSGSPIIQDNKIFGAVTHVVVSKPNTGYGIFITTMLSEGES